MKIHHYRLTISFNGKAYLGWQRQSADQPGTVQQTLEETLRRIFKEPELCVTGCSRTDTGVHAASMTVSFSAETEMTPSSLQELLTLQLPHDIRILSIERQPSVFNAQKTFGKSYIYCIYIGPPSVFLKELTWNWSTFSKREEMELALNMLIGTHDFRNFTRHTMGLASTERTIFRTDLKIYGSVACIYISGSGFLNKMVRRIAALLYEIEKGNLHAVDFQKALMNEPSCELPDVVAPPRGLFLKKVFYGPEEWQQDSLDLPPFLF